MKLEIRPMTQDDSDLLPDFLAHAIFQEDPSQPLPADLLEQPELKAYIQHFGGPDDHGLLAFCGGSPVGAAWARILYHPVKGFGNIGPNTPELAISVLPAFRKRGIGTQLLDELLGVLADAGYTQVSLSVQKKNYALGMYQKAGFVAVREDSQEAVMVRRLSLF